MRDRSERDIHRRGTVHKRDWSKRWLSGRRDVRRDANALRDWPLVECAEFHPEVMRMLAIVERLAVIALSTLQKQRIAARRDGPWVETQHCSSLEAPTGELVTRHEHSPIERARLRLS